MVYVVTRRAERLVEGGFGWPEWSPDGTSIAYTTTRDDETFVDDDGSVTGTFRLTPDEGMVFLAGVDAERRRLYDGVAVEDHNRDFATAA